MVEVYQLDENCASRLELLESICRINYHDSKMLGFHNFDSYEEDFNNGAKYFGIFNKGKLIASGGLQAYLNQQQSDFSEGEVVVLVSDLVHPDFRGNGLQRILIKERVDYSLFKKYSDIRAFINPENNVAIKNFECEGFQKESCLDLYGVQAQQYAFKGLNLKDKFKLKINYFFR